MTRAGGQYFDDDETEFRRYGHRGGHGYPLSHGRELPASTPYSTSREHHLSVHDSRNGNHTSDNNTRPRSRIPVACGRCRKRKIRCSGDLGGGLPCTNCKSAGNDNCQFLRVSSHEATIKNESASFDFEGSSAAARSQCRMVPYGPQAYFQQAAPTGDGVYQRPLSVYQYQPVKYCSVPPFEYQDENEYGLQGPYSTLGSEHLLPSNYAIPNPTRTWIPTPQIAKNASMYVEQESAYNHGQIAYHSFPLRTQVSSEAKSSHLGNQQLINTSLPTTVAGNDRVLPFPGASRSQGVSYVRSGSGSGSSGIPQPGFQSYDGIMSSTPQAPVKTINSSTVSENGSLSSSYNAYSSSSPESLASTHTAYSSQTASQQTADIYASSNDGLYATEPTEASYGPSSDPPKRGTQSSHAGHETSGNLVNGHAYIPYNSQTSYPAPPMDLPVHPPPTRRSSNSITASS